MIASRSTPAEGIVLKRVNTGETDRVVTILTRQYGKVAGVAKGVRKLTSSKQSYLEPGNHVRVLLIQTKSLPIITQASLAHQALSAHASLKRMRSLVQWLEIMDKLFVEEELNAEIFSLVLSTRALCLAPQVDLNQIQKQFAQLITLLGFNDTQEEKTYSITQFVNTIADRPLKGFEYLTLH